MTKTLKVILWGEEIGRLAWDERRKRSYFIYNPEWLKTTIIDHLKAWGEWDESELPEFSMNGHSVSNIRMEQAYKGNYHLLAEIDGKERKFVIGKNNEEFALIEKTGISNLTPDQLQAMVEKYFFS